MISSLFVEVRMLVGILFGKLTINSHKNILLFMKIEVILNQLYIFNT